MNFLSSPEFQYTAYLIKENNQVTKSMVSFFNDRDTKIRMVLDNKLDKKAKELERYLTRLAKILADTLEDFENHYNNGDISKIHFSLNIATEISQKIKLKFENIKSY